MLMNLKESKILDFIIFFALQVLQVFFATVLIISILYALKNLYMSFPNLKDMLKTAVADGLYIFILIELIRSISYYFKYRRVKLTIIIDTAIIFILRELMIGLFQHKLDGYFLISMAFSLLLIMIMRVMAIKFSPKTKLN